MTRRLLGCLMLLTLSAPSGAAELEVETLTAGLEYPWSLAFVDEGDLLITERPGRLRRFRDGQLSEPIQGLPEVYAAGQGGLLEVLLDPDFASNQRVYLSYAHGSPEANATRVARARLHGTQLSD